MKHNTVVAIVIIILAVIVLLAFGGVFGTKGVNAPAPDLSSDKNVETSKGNTTSSSGGSGPYIAETCPGIKITSPSSGAKVAFPLTVTGVIHPVSANARQWIVFEGEAGTVSVRGNNVDELVAAPVIIRLQGDWMNTAPKPFTATISSRINPKYSNKATLIFRDADASGQNQHTCVVPITL